MKKVILSILILFLMLFLLTGCSEESKAKNAVNDYLSYIKNGDESKAWDLLDDEEGLIDVFSYKFLRKINEKNEYEILDFTRDDYETTDIWKDEYNSWEEMRTKLIKLYSDTNDYKIIEKGEDELRVKDLTKKIKNYTLLYNAEIANAGGEKLYKKIEFTVKEDEDGVKITSINIRGE